MREPDSTTKHIFFVVFVMGCGCAGSTTTFLLGSAANADAQNANATAALTHRTDQPRKRLGLPTVFTP
jgi:hypothetical protein